jgi:N,N'-diacetyllegionaminate synthase
VSAFRSVVDVGGREIGPGRPCFVIAEAGVNHNGDVELARRLVDVAADAGADAVKFQTFRAEAVVAAEAPKAAYQLETTSPAETQREMLDRLELDAGAFSELKARAEERGLVFLSTPFDAESVDVLDELGVAAFKVASPDLVNYLLLDDVAARGRPVILSTGLAELGEVESAVARLRSRGCDQVLILHCVSEYPARPEDANLRAIATLADRLSLPVGFSDHTVGEAVPLAAVAVGAVALEKHFTLDRGLAGPDHAASLEPEELRRLVTGIRDVEASLGSGVKRPADGELRNLVTVRRSLAAVDDLPSGTALTAGMLIALRPATGISPSLVDDVVGRTLSRALARGEILRPEDLE